MAEILRDHKGGAPYGANLDGGDWRRAAVAVERLEERLEQHAGDPGERAELAGLAERLRAAPPGGYHWSAILVALEACDKSDDAEPWPAVGEADLRRAAVAVAALAAELTHAGNRPAGLRDLERALLVAAQYVADLGRTLAELEAAAGHDDPYKTGHTSPDGAEHDDGERMPFEDRRQ